MNDTLKELGQQIKAAREAAGLTQREMAHHCSVTIRTFSKWETGVAQMGVLDYMRICRVLNTPMHNLLPEVRDDGDKALDKVTAIRERLGL